MTSLQHMRRLNTGRVRSSHDLIARTIGKEILTVAGIRASVELAAPRTLERFVGKARRVVDKRKPGQ